MDGEAVDVLKCPYGGQTTRERVDRLRKDFDDHERVQERTIKDLYEKINTIFEKYGNRLPPWGTAFVSVLCTLLGMCIGIITMLAKFYGG